MLYLWIDLETTGLDPARCAIAEVGALLTDESGERGTVTRRGDDTFDAIVRLTADDWQRGDGPALTMAAANGLLTDTLSETDGVASPLAVVDAALADWITRRANGQRVMLAGSGLPHLDMPFMRAHMPRTMAAVVWYVVDVGIMRRMLRAAGVRIDTGAAGDASTKTHRALSDAKQHAAEWAIIHKALATSSLALD